MKNSSGMLDKELPMRYNFRQFPSYNNMSHFSPGKSWLLINLLYHVLGVNSCFFLSIKFNLLQLKILTIQTSCFFCALFWGTFPCADFTASFWDMQAKTHVSLNIHLLYFLPIMVNFLLILLSLHLIKHYWSSGYHWHICFMSAIKVKTQTRFMFLFTSGSLLTWGKSPCTSPGISPRYLPAIYF